MIRRNKSKECLTKAKEPQEDENLEQAWESNRIAPTSKNIHKGKKKNNIANQKNLNGSLQINNDLGAKQNKQDSVQDKQETAIGYNKECDLEVCSVESQNNNDEEEYNEMQASKEENEEQEEENSTYSDNEIEKGIQGNELLAEGNKELDEKEKQRQKKLNIKKALEFRESQNRKGVVYLSRIPPYMKVNQLRKLFSPYNVERIYLTPEDESKRKFRIKTGGNKRRNYTEGWMEFQDKKMAKYVALVFNNQKIGGKKHSFYTEDVLNLKYLPKFKWENLTEKINYDMKMRKEKLKAELNMAKKQHDFYLDQVEKGKQIMGIKKYKDSKRAAIEDIESVLYDGLHDETRDHVQEGKDARFGNEKDRIRRTFKQKKPKVQ